MNKQTADFLIEGITEDLVKRLVHREGKTLNDAVCDFLNSETYDKLRDPLTGLYIESPSFVFAMYMDELRYGRLSQ